MYALRIGEAIGFVTSRTSTMRTGMICSLHALAREARVTGVPRPRLLECARRAQNESIVVHGPDDLQANRQSIASEAARDRRRGLLRQVERIREGRPHGPVT